MPLTLMSPLLAGQLERAELTYREVGQTAGVLPGLPPGYRHLRRAAAIGSGAATFTEAAAALLGWQAHLRAGLRVSASTVIAEPGTVVLLSAGAGPARLSAPCRVVYVVSEPWRCGFAYGTLPGHPESGEEAFLLEQQDDGTVTFTVTAFSRAATALARAAGPLGRAIQSHLTSRYLRALYR
jgi:uncharacterized protein (UPF0548 family)